MRAAVIAIVLVAACGPGTSGGGGTIDAAGGDDDGAPDASHSGPPYDDFPGDPIVEPGAPADAPDVFGEPGSATGGPCLTEPEVGALLPLGWLRPRFRLAPAGSQSLFEVRLSAASQSNELVVYTSNLVWTMPTAMWEALQLHSVDEPITVTVRGVTWTGSAWSEPSTGSTGDIRIAPVSATGSIVYWTSAGGSALKGFNIGEETVHPVMTPAQAGTTCLGCHTSTPDGQWIGFSASAVYNDGRPARVDLRRADGTPGAAPFITASAATLLARTFQQEPVFSDAHWADGDHLAVSVLEQPPKTEIAWTDLEATDTTQGTAWGIVARTGDTRNAAGAVWSHDGETIAYISAAYVSSGINTDQGGADIYTVPFAGGAGGNATGLAGAATTQYSESYPAFSEDDAWVAFTRVPTALASYDEPVSEVYVVPAAGGTAVRLRANDPPACSGAASPGVTNSWPKWSPAVGHDGNTDYYWLTFSSRRGDSGLPQIYVAPIVVEGATVTTYPALYLWNQPDNEANHTPAWDIFDIVVD